MESQFQYSLCCALHHVFIVFIDFHYHEITIFITKKKRSKYIAFFIESHSFNHKMFFLPLGNVFLWICNSAPFAYFLNHNPIFPISNLKRPHFCEPGEIISKGLKSTLTLRHKDNFIELNFFE